jgi:hypothetical protein
MDAREDQTAQVDEQEHSDAADRAARFGHLPDRVPPEQMVEESPADAPSDPDFGRNPDNDWMVRYSA